MGSGREAKDKGDISLHIADSCCYTTESNTAL